jgi:hypothetical protein
MFFEARNGTRYPFSRVRAITPNWKENTAIVELDNDGRVSVELSMWDQALATIVQSTIPASPGFYILTPVWEEDGSTTYEQETIVAWIVNGRGELRPATADGVTETDIAILMPNGTVAEPFIRNHTSLEEYIQAKLTDSRP